MEIRRWKVWTICWMVEDLTFQLAVGFPAMGSSVRSNTVLEDDQERYPGRRCPDRKTFESIHCCLCEHENFAPRVAYKGQQRSTRRIFWMLRMKLLESAQEGHQCTGVSLMRLSGECCENNSCNPTICSMYMPSHYKITLREYCSASGSYNSVVNILNSLLLWYLRMKHSSQEMESRIVTISICGQMEIHMRYFHHITNSGSQSTSGPVFVVIIYSGPTYFQTGVQGGITKLSWKTTSLISWSTCHWSFAENWTLCMMTLPHISVSLPAGTWIESFLVGG
jgi:hypothetical protein